MSRRHDETALSHPRATYTDWSHTTKLSPVKHDDLVMALNMAYR
jgi:hypothetical protein